MTFAELAKDAVEHSRAENGERSTKELELKVDALVEAFGRRPAQDIKKQDIVRWLQTQAVERNWKPATVNRWQAALSLIFRVGIDNEKIEQNPASRIRRKTENNGRVRFLSAQEEQKIRALILKRSPKHLPAFDISIHTGMRAGEQFDLKWSQVSFIRRTVTLPKTKNGDVRHIPLNRTALMALEQLHKTNKRTPWVFLNSEGEKLRGPRDWFDPVLKEAGLKDYTWHCNRHTFASRLVMAGVELRTVGELLGHRSLQMTLRYAHLAADHKQNAVERLCGDTSATKSATRKMAANGRMVSSRAKSTK